jgi:hypothetical protein
MDEVIGFGGGAEVVEATGAGEVVPIFFAREEGTLLLVVVAAIFYVYCISIFIK